MKKITALLLSLFMTVSFMTCTSFAQTSDVEITSLSAVPARLWGVVEDNIVNAPEAAAVSTNIENLSLTPVWKGADGFEFGSKAVGNQLISYTVTYTAPDGYVFAQSLADATENTTLSADGKALTYKLYSYVIPKDAIYIDDAGSDSTDDYAEGNFSHPYKTIDHAMSLLEAKGGGVIVIVDLVTETTSGNKGTVRTGDYTIMGWDKNSTFKTTASTSSGGHYYIRGNTTFRDLTIYMTRENAGIYTRGFNLTFGDKNYSDLTVTCPDNSKSNYKQIMMHGDGGEYTNPGKLTINNGAFGSIIGSGYGLTTVDGNIEFEMNGGSASSLTLGLLAGSNSGIHTVNGNINAVINGGTIGNLNLGSSSPYYLHNGNCTATINGGTVSNISFRTGNADKTLNDVQLPQQNGDYALTINGGTITGRITDSSNGTTGVTGTTTVDIINYNGDRAALLKKITTSQFDVVKSTIIYLDYENGDDANDGLSKDTALKTMTAALKKFANNVSGKIFICGEYAAKNGFTDTKGRGEVTITGYDENALFLFGGPNIDMYGSTVIENIKINVIEEYDTLRMGGNKLVMGYGIEMVTDERSKGLFQISGGTDGAHSIPMDSVDVTINSGTYGTVSAVGTLYGKSITGDVNFTINGGTFTGAVYMGSYCNPAFMTGPLNDDNSGKIGGNINFTMNGGQINSQLYLGGKQPGTVGGLNAKINGGEITGSISVGPVLASYNAETQDGTTFKDGNEYSFTTDILGDAIVEISGGNITGAIARTNNAVNGKSAVILTNSTSASVTKKNFNYIVNAGKNGTVKYDSATDKFSIVPKNDGLDIFVNGALLTKSEDNIYTLSGGTDNVYNITFGGETHIAEKFVITAPVAELTPVSDIILTGGKNVYNPLASCTAGKVTWEPADAMFKHDTQYTATVVLKAKSGIEFSDDFSGLNVNNNYSGNTVTCTLSEDKTEITVKVTFPKTAKKELAVLAEKTTDVTVSFTTKRDGEDTAKFHPTTVTLTNVNDSEAVYTGTATEEDTDGTFSATVQSGIYNITVKKQGYLEASLEGVMIDSDTEQLIDAGTLIPGDIIDGSGNTAGDGKIDIDDFIISLRALAEDASEAVTDAANICESEVYNVSQIGFVKSGFDKTSEDDASKYNGYFENTYYRLTVDKKLTVGYIGGSIIQGASGAGTQTYNEGNAVKAGNEKFIDRMQGFFEENFPDAEIHSINAGISDTGSNFALFRINEDMMYRDEGYVPDLVFLEFCVNDFGSIGSNVIEIQYESVINQVYKANPNADIVCLLTAFGGYDVSKNAHIKVANHYGIPIVDLGAQLRRDYDISGDCKVFTNDNLHPNGAGYEYYTKLCVNLLEKYIIGAVPQNPKYTEKVLPEPLKNCVIYNPEKIVMTDARVVKSEGSSWTETSSNAMSRIFDKSTKKIPCITSDVAGDSFTFEFTGDAFGFIIRQSPSMGSFEYSVDGGQYKEFVSSKTYTHYQTYLMETGLENKKHTVTVRVTGKDIGTQAGCTVGIAGILYNDTSAK